MTTKRPRSLLLVMLLGTAVAIAAACVEDDDTPPLAATTTVVDRAAGDQEASQDERVTDRSILAGTDASTTTRVEVPVSGRPDSGRPLTGLVVVVDPGHNGANARHPSQIGRQVDAGGFTKACNTTGTASDDGWPEAAFNWEMAQLFGELLTERGASVVSTRTDNEGWGPCVDERGQRAAEAGAHILISLHADGGPAAGRGFHVIHAGSVAGYTDDTAADSAALAVMVRDRLRTAGLTAADYIAVDGLDERTDLGTLNRSPVPAVMVELGNMRNDLDLAAMRDPGWREAAATALTFATADFWSERSNGPSPSAEGTQP